MRSPFANPSLPLSSSTPLAPTKLEISSSTFPHPFFHFIRKFVSSILFSILENNAFLLPFEFEKFHRFINSNEFLSFPAHTSREVRFSILLTERLKNPPGRGGGGGGSRYLLFPSVRCQMVSERLKKKKCCLKLMYSWGRPAYRV